MKKTFLLLAIGVLAFGSNAFAMPKFKELNNEHGKTTIKIEIPASDRDATNGLSVDNIKLYNNGEMLKAKKVDAIWGENSLIIFEFKKLTTFEDCSLSFTINGEPVSIDIQSIMNKADKYMPLPPL